GIATPLLVLSLAGAGGLFQQFVRASGVLLTGAFVVAMLVRPGAVFARAALAVGLAAAAALVWGARLGFGWPQVQTAAAHETSAFFASHASGAASQGAARRCGP